MPPQLDLKLKSAPFQIEMWCSWLASWPPAVAWPAAAQLPGWLAGRSLAHQLAGWKLVERINVVTG